MKTPKKPKSNDEVRSEYDFTGAQRGRFYKPLNQGYSVHIRQEDGTTVVNQYTLAEGTILLEPDVRAYFPDSQAVNDALRSLIRLMERVPSRKYTQRVPKSRQVAERRK
jgi:hypothetical protein